MSGHSALVFPNLLDKRIVAGAFHTGFSKWLTRYFIFTVLNISNTCWLNHILDGWNPISNGMFTTYQLWISPLRTWSARASHEGASSSTSSSTFVAPSKRNVSPVAVIIGFLIVGFNNFIVSIVGFNSGSRTIDLKKNIWNTKNLIKLHGVEAPEIWRAVCCNDCHGNDWPIEGIVTFKRPFKGIYFGDFPLPSLITGGYVQLKISEISTSTSIGEALRAWFQQL